MKLNENAILVPSEFTAQVMPVAANANDMLLPITMGTKYLLKNSLIFINIYGIKLNWTQFPSLGIFVEIEKTKTTFIISVLKVVH